MRSGCRCSSQPSRWLAVAEIFVLFMAIGATLTAFRQHSRLAAWLLAPYLGWVGFLAILNMQVWKLNVG